MSYRYSQKSRDILSTVDIRLQQLFHEVINHVDIRIVEGIRTVERQKELVATGKSKTMNSKHLKGLAIDFVPMKGLDVSYNINDCVYVAGIIKGIASQMQIGCKIRLGADWDGDNIISDEKFLDAVHIEIRD